MLMSIHIHVKGYKVCVFLFGYTVIKLMSSSANVFIIDGDSLCGLNNSVDPIGLDKQKNSA